MPIIIKLQDIDEAIENLHYKSETTLKFKLLRALRQYYTDDESADTLQAIDTEELVRTVWETGNDRELIKTKRKNFSSLKSSVNSDLKKLYAEGKNPQGIVIGHNNVFSISDEAKDKALAGIMDVFRDKGIDTQSKISEILSVLNDILSSSITGTDAENTREEIDRLKTILSGISGKLGFSIQDLLRRAQTASGEKSPAGESDTGMQTESGPREEGPLARGTDGAWQDIPGKGKDLSGYIRGGLSLIDQSLQGLAREIEEASAGDTRKDLVESVHEAIDDIVAVLQDSKSDPPGKARKIMVSVNRMLHDTLNASGVQLPAHQAEALRKIFSEMTATAADGGSDRDAADGGLYASVLSILGDKSLNLSDRFNRMMAAVYETIGEAIARGETGLNPEEVSILRQKMAAVTGPMTVSVPEAPGGAGPHGRISDSLRGSLSGVVEALGDSEADQAGKTEKVLAALESVFHEAIDTLGEPLSDNQAKELKQILSNITGAVREEDADRIKAGHRLGETVSEILAGGALSAGGRPSGWQDKIGQILAAVENMVGDMLDAGTSGVDEEEAARLKAAMGALSGRVEALLAETPAGPDDQALSPEEPLRAAMSEMIHALRDSKADATDTTPQILDAVSNLFEDAIDNAGKNLSPEQTGELKRLLQEMAKDKDGRLVATISGILGRKELSTVDKISRILNAARDAIGQAVEQSGGEMTDTDQTRIRDLLSGIADNLEMLGLETLSGLEFVEEIVEEGTGEGFEEVIEEIASDGTAGTDVSGEEAVTTEASAMLESAEETAAGVEIIEEIIEEGSDHFEVVEEATGAGGTTVIEELSEETGAVTGVESADETRTGAPTGDEQTAVRSAMGHLIEALQDTQTDGEDKAQKIMQAMEGLLDTALEGTGLSETQTESLRQILSDMAHNPAGPLGHAVSDILADGGMSSGAKIGKMLAALGDTVNEAMDEAGPDLSEEDRERIRKVLASIAGDIEAHGIEALAALDIVEEVVEEETGAGGLGDTTSAGTATLAGSEADAQASAGKAFAEIAAILRDTQTDTAGKAAKILNTVEGMLGGTVSGADKFRDTVSAILGEEELSNRDKLYKIISAVGDMLEKSSDDISASVKDEDRERIRKLLQSITEDPATLAGLEVVEEVVEEATGAGGTTVIEELSEETGAGPGVEAEAGTGDRTSDEQTAVRSAMTHLIEALQDNQTDGEGKSQKIMQAMEDLLDTALEEAGLSETQTESLRQIMQGIVSDPEGPLGHAVSDILADGGMSSGAKIGKMLAALGDTVNEAMDEAGPDLSEEDRERIRKVLASIAGDIEAHGIEALAALDIVEEVVEEATGAGGTVVIEELSEETGGVTGVESADETGTGAPTGNEQTAMRSALTHLIEALQDNQTDGEGKSQKILQAMEGLMDTALEGAGLSEAQAESLRQIMQGIVSDPEGPLGHAVSDILADGGMSSGAKIGKMLAALGDTVNEAMDEAGPDLSEEDRERIRKVLASIAGDIEAHGIEALAALDIVEEVVEEETGAGGLGDTTSAGTATLAGSEADAQASAGKAFAEIAAILRDTQTDAAGKAAKILNTVEGMLGDAISTSGGFADEEKGDVRQILISLADDLTEGKRVSELTGARMTAAVSDILADGSMSAADKIGKIMGAVNDLISEALTQGSGLSTEEQARIREMLSNITANLEAFGHEALDGLDIVEEFIQEGESAQAKDTGAQADGFIKAVSPATAAADETDSGAADGEGPSGESPMETGKEAADGFVAQDVASEESEVPEEADYVEEMVEEAVLEAPDIQVTPTDKDIDAELREKTDLLTRLAEAAGMLAGLGPDLNGSVYTEEEIRGKAKFLSEEFDRYLSVRDKFYNAHILIKGGNYRVGGPHLAKSVLPEQIARLPDFYIGKFPVTNALFEIFVEQTGYVTTAEKYGFGLVYYPRMQRSRDPITGVERFSLHNQAYSKKVSGACWHRPQGPDSSLHLKRTHPVVQVSLEDARAFAVWTGKRLPTEIEWEAAARMAQGLLFPWGNDWRDEACNTERSLHGDTTPVDQYVKFANTLGVADMLGNVLEWTSDVVGDPEMSDTCIAKGASWISHDEISLTDRHYIEKNLSSNILGFRCVAI